MPLMLKEWAIALVMLARWWLFRGTSFDQDGWIQDTKNFRNSYDFIIVGAGSSGSVIANRLTEIGDWNVLLIEAGEEESILGQIPVTASFLQLTKADWQYTTTPQGKRACLLMKNNRCPWPNGKSLGGSSAINYMIYVRGNKRDFDLWEAEGCTGWSYKDVLPYFLKSEDNQNPYVAQSKYHSTGGYQPVSHSGYRSVTGAAFLQGGVEMGYKISDYNGEFQTGFGFSQLTVKDDTRYSTNRAFLRPIRYRKNLHITTKSYVTKVLLDQDGTKAIGVQFRKNGRIYEVLASKEVILSGGAVASPKILMLSGIGHKEHLAEKGIKVYADLPVGDNLQDPVGVGGFTFLIDPPYGLLAERLISVPVLLNYTVYGGTPFSLAGGVEALGFVNTKYANASEDWPDLQYHFASGSDISDPTVKDGHGITDQFWNEYFVPIKYKDTWSVIINAQRPKSRGTIRLASSDPFEKPIIEPNYFSDPDNYDLNVTIEGIKIALALSKTEALRKLNSRYHDKKIPGCESYKMYTDEYWACYVRSYTFTLLHNGGTVKMGRVNDTTTVVDPRLRVKGIKSLRVADGSIMPHVVSGNTNAAAIMIGEKAADIIKEDWGQPITPFVRSDKTVNKKKKTNHY